MRRTVPATILAGLLLLSSSLQAGAAVQTGYDPRDSDGPGDIRLVTVRRGERHGVRSLIVGVRGHAGATFRGYGVVKWVLDARGGQAADHVIQLRIHEVHGGPVACRMRIPGQDRLRGHVIHAERLLGCRFALADTRIERRPRFRAASRLDDLHFDFHVDRAPNELARSYH